MCNNKQNNDRWGFLFPVNMNILSQMHQQSFSFKLNINGETSHSDRWVFFLVNTKCLCNYPQSDESHHESTQLLHSPYSLPHNQKKHPLLVLPSVVVLIFLPPHCLLLTHLPQQSSSIHFVVGFFSPRLSSLVPSSSLLLHSSPMLRIIMFLTISLLSAPFCLQIHPSSAPHCTSS